MSHPMTNRQWVTLLYFFARQSHQSCLIPWPTGSEWHCFISLPGSLINYDSFHDQQYVSDTALFLCQAVSSIMTHPMTNREWVTLLYFFARQSHQSWLIPWPTVCEWHCCISLQGSLINHVSSHDQKDVSDTALHLCQAVSSIMSHPMTNREWATVLFLSQAVKSSHCQQSVSDFALFLSQAVSPIMPHPMTSSWTNKWVTSASCLSQAIWLIMSHPMTNREWVTLSLPDSLINHVSSHDQQRVSNTTLFVC